jgi:heptosyltransferase-2
MAGPAADPRPAAVVIQTSFLGDVVLTTPLLAALAARGPVDVVTTPAGARLLANHPAVRRLIPYDKRGAARGIRGLHRTARAIADGGDPPPSIAYLAQGSLRSATLAFLAGIKRRVGFASSAGRRLYTERVPYPAEWHHAERLWALAAAPGTRAGADALRPRLYPGAEEQAQVDALLEGTDAARRPFIALAPGSVWATKRWPGFPELAHRLADEYAIVIVGGPEDAGLAEGITAAVPSAVDATGQLPLLASAALIGRARAIVTNDSAPQHLASAVGTPTVAIFGPTVPAFGFGPLAPVHAIAEHPAMPCRPCDKHGPMACPLSHFKCMRELPADGIAAQARAAATAEVR